MESVEAPQGYTIVRVIGRGGMGMVVQARDMSSGRLIALKYLHVEARGHRDRFLREGRLSTELKHPNIVEGLGIEFVDDAPVLLYEFVEGTDLKAHLEQRGKLPVDRAIDVAKQVLAGLAHAHRAGIVHRDLKSANVMITSAGVAKLADFGTAHLRDAHEKLTRTGALIGTPAYMAPEQAMGEAIDARADLYAVGVLLFEMIAGRLPFAAANPMALLLMARYDAPPRLDEVEPSAGKRIADIVDCCLAKKAEHRYPSADALIAALEQGGPPSRSVKTQRVPVLGAPGVRAAGVAERNESASTTPPEGATLPPGGAALPAGPPAGPRSRATGRSRALVASVPAPAPAAGPPRWALALAALGLVALGAVGAWIAQRPATPSPSPSAAVAVARPLAITNEMGGAFVVRLDGRIALSFATDTTDPLRATMSGGGVAFALEPIAKHTGGTVHAFSVPANRVVEPFDVRLTRADGLPVQGGVVHHDGLWAVVEAWDRRLAVPDGKSGTADVWPGMLDQLARAVGMTGDGARFAAMGRGSGELDRDEMRYVVEVARRAASQLPPLLLAVTAVLDAPVAKVPLARKKKAYHALLPARILDRLLACAGREDLGIGAEKALGARLATIETAASAIPVVNDERLNRVALTSGGGLKRGGEDSNMLSGLVSNSAMGQKREVYTHSAELKIAEPAAAPAARLDVQFKIWQGVAEPLPADELVFVALPDHGWLLLLHAGCTAVEGGDPRYMRWVVHKLEPELLSPRTPLRFSREVLRKKSAEDRRAGALWLYRVIVRAGDEMP